MDATTFDNPFEFLVMTFTGGFWIAFCLHFAIFKMSGAPRMIESFWGPD